MILFRPVGLEEMRLVVESELRAFPPRLPEQPIFYPVLTHEYAVEIARDWNTKDESSGFAGYVTRFEISDAYAARFERRRAGARRHEELWVPADELGAFNAEIVGRIAVTEAFFGSRFRGHASADGGMPGKDVVSQFAALARMRREEPANFAMQIHANRAAIFLHYPFWRAFDFSGSGISSRERDEVLREIEAIWASASAALALPRIEGEVPPST